MAGLTREQKRAILEREAKGLRKCARCCETKKLGEFYKDSPKGKKYSYCRICSCANTKVWRNSLPEEPLDPQKEHEKTLNRARNKTYREKNREMLRLRQRCHPYNITPSEYLELFRKQNGKCKICGVPHLETNRGLFIDHCHDTDKIRGLLCHACNQVLGFSRENPVILKNAIKYIEVETAGSYIQESNF